MKKEIEGLAIQTRFRNSQQQVRVYLRFRKRMLEVNVAVCQVQRWIETGTHDRKTVFVASINHHKAWHTRRVFHRLEFVPDVSCDCHLVVRQALVTRSPQTNQLVQLDQRSRRRSGEIERHGVTLATKVADADGNVLGEFLSLAKDNPPSATNTLTKLVARCRDGQNVGETKVPGGQVVLERSDEATRRAVHMDSDLPAVRLVKLCHGSIKVPDRIVLAVVMVSHDTHYRHGLLITHSRDIFGVHGEILDAGLHELGLDVEVFEELKNKVIELG